MSTIPKSVFSDVDEENGPTKDELVAEFQEHHESTIEVIKIEELSVDPAVQRTLDPKWVNARKGKKFRRDGLGVFQVSRRDSGMLHLIDGQHRHSLCVEVGYPGPVPCQVYSGLTTAEEAFLFSLLNDSRKVPLVDTFNMDVQAGDPTSVKLNELLKNEGWTVRASSSPYSFRAVSALKQLYRGWGTVETENLGVCKTVLSIVTAAWGGDPHGMRAQIITAIGLVLMRHGTDVRIDKLVNQMHNWPGGAEALCLQAKALKIASNCRIEDAMADKLINMLNANIPRKSKNLLPKWGTE